MTPDHTLAVQAVTANSAIRHSRHAALTVKDAVADRFRDLKGRRPNVDTDAPDVALHLFMHRNRAVCSLDLGGGSLHRRGYRLDAVDAPMQETLAATMVRASGWTGDSPLLDPFCGSGTLLAEAWMVACRIPAGFLRKKWGISRLPDHDADMWCRVRASMDECICVPREIAVMGSDIDAAAIAVARKNLARLPEGHRVGLERRDVQSLPGLRNAVILANPPYGVRLGRREDADALLRDFGDVLKQRCAGSEAIVFFGDVSAIKTLGLKPSWKRAVQNGGLGGRLCRYTLFEGPADRQRASSAGPSSPEAMHTKRGSTDGSSQGSTRMPDDE